MVYNGNSDEQDIVSQIADSTGVNKTADIKRITRAVNETMRLIWAWIFESYGGWQYDDANQTNLPSATTALVANQQKYTIPSDAITVRQVSYKDTAGNWHDVDPITAEDIHSVSEETEFYDTPGLPRYYRMIGNVINIYPAANYSQPASLRMQFDRGSVAFTSTDTSKTPGFVSEFHGAVSVGASFIIASDKTLKNTNNLAGRWAEYERNIKAYYKARFAELNPVKKKSYQTDPLSECQ